MNGFEVLNFSFVYYSYEEYKVEILHVSTFL